MLKKINRLVSFLLLQYGKPKSWVDWSIIDSPAGQVKKKLVVSVVVNHLPWDMDVSGFLASGCPNII